MDNTINGKTPEEIKRGLECCSQNTYTCGEGCPYEVECQRMGRSNDVILDALAYIQQLERERDAAVERLARYYRKCIDCVRYPEVKKNLFCDDCVQGSKWQWCGEPLEVQHGMD